MCMHVRAVEELKRGEDVPIKSKIQSQSGRDAQIIVAPTLLPPLNSIAIRNFQAAKSKHDQTGVFVCVCMHTCTHGKISDIIKHRERVRAYASGSVTPTGG